MVAELWCDQKTKDKLGEAGLNGVAACLWAQDCQSCGQALGTEPPALCVDELSGYATAGLHHRGCRPPGWNDSSLIITSSGDVLTWEACTFLLPAMAGDRPDPRPALLVNPGLEQVTLKPADGTWQLSYGAPFDTMGLAPPGPGLALNRPVTGATAWLGAGEISVSIELWSREYAGEAHEPTLAAAHRLGGVLLMVTHALRPSDLDEPSLYQLLQSGRVLCGWAAAWQQ
jgi:hypothetical protein